MLYKLIFKKTGLFLFAITISLVLTGCWTTECGTMDTNKKFIKRYEDNIKVEKNIIEAKEINGTINIEFKQKITYDIIEKYQVNKRKKYIIYSFLPGLIASSRCNTSNIYDDFLKQADDSVLLLTTPVVVPLIFLGGGFFGTPISWINESINDEWICPILSGWYNITYLEELGFKPSGYSGGYGWYTNTFQEDKTIGWVRSHHLSAQLAFWGLCKYSLKAPCKIEKKVKKSKRIKNVENANLVLKYMDLRITVPVQDGKASVPLNNLPVFSKTKEPIEICYIENEDTTVRVELKCSFEKNLKNLFSGKIPATNIYIDGRKFDFTQAQPHYMPHPVVMINKLGQDNLDSSLYLVEISIKNAGKGNLYRVTAKSDNDLLIFGRIKPGETVKEITRVSLSNMSAGISKKVKLSFSEANNYQPLPCEVTISQSEIKMPKLVYSTRVVDDSKAGERIVGNADGVIQRGEAVDLVVTAKNIGQAKAKNTKLLITLDKDKSLELFSAQEIPIGDLAPGEVRECRFNIAVRSWSHLKVLPVKLALSESSFNQQESKSLNLPFDVKIKRNPIVIDQNYYVAAYEAILREGASGNASEFGKVPKNASLHAVGELDDWIQVKLSVKENGKQAKRLLWVKRKELTMRPPLGRIAASTVVNVTKFDVPAPSIVFVSPNTDKFCTTEDKFKLTVSIAAGAGKLKSVKLFDNKQRLRGLKAVSTKAKLGASQVINQTVYLKMGRNIFKVIAENGNGKVSTRTLTVDRVPRRGKTYSICIGINKYKSKPLGVARQDAVAMYNFIKKRFGVTSENAHLLVDKKATRRAILKVFGKVRKTVKPEDSLIVFLAGHGIIDEDKTSYFMPFDGNWNELFSTAIRMSDFDHLLNMKVARILVIADACHSSSIIKIRGKKEIFAKLAGKGRQVIGYQSPAEENQKLGHGYMTYYMLEGMKGKADSDKNGEITIREIFEYTNKKVKEKTGSGLWMQGEGNIKLLKMRP